MEINIKKRMSTGRLIVRIIIKVQESTKIFSIPMTIFYILFISFTSFTTLHSKYYIKINILYMKLTKLIQSYCAF